MKYTTEYVFRWTDKDGWPRSAIFRGFSQAQATEYFKRAWPKVRHFSVREK